MPTVLPPTAPIPARPPTHALRLGLATPHFAALKPLLCSPRGLHLAALKPIAVQPLRPLRLAALKALPLLFSSRVTLHPLKGVRTRLCVSLKESPKEIMESLKESPKETVNPLRAFLFEIVDFQ